MPNWCDNDLEVSGPFRKVEQFRKDVERKDDDTVFSLQNLIPIPDTLREAEAGSREELHTAMYGSDEEIKMLCKLYEVEWSNRGDLLSAISKKYGLDVSLSEGMGRTYNHNTKTYGHRTWYSWCISNWGTKWDTCRSTIKKDVKKDGQRRLTYNFDTAWSPPVTALEKISELYPDLKFKLKYYEAGMGFKGIFIIKAGSVIRNVQADYSGPRGG